MKAAAPLLAVALVLASCRERYQRCEPETFIPSFTDYDVAPSIYTAGGIAVDTSGQPVNLAAIDALTDDVEACLHRTLGPDLPERVWAAASCGSRSWGVKRQCLTVKIAPDWRVGEWGDQIIPHGTGAACKGSTSPCFFRTVVQDSLTIVTTPDLKLYEAGVAQIATGCQYPWSSPEIAACIRVPAAAGVTP